MIPFANHKIVLAYIIGIALGDGNLSNPNGRAVRLRISCDTVYPKLIKHISHAIQILLPKNKVSFIKRKARCIDISCYSNQWPQLLGWDVGDKQSQEVHIPEWIQQNEKYIIPCIRGLIETDGSVYNDRGYKTVFFTSTIKKLANDVYFSLQQLGYTPKFYSIQPSQKDFKKRQIRYNIRLTKNVDHFITLVQPNKA